MATRNCDKDGVSWKFNSNNWGDVVAVIVCV